MKTIIKWIWPGLAVLAADAIVKTWCSDMKAVLIPGVVALRPARNTGMALGMFQGGVVSIIILSAVLAALCLWLMRGYRITGLGRAGISLMAGGALGNLWDRIVLGYVRDMFKILFMDFYIFNVADVGVVVGAVLCGISLLFRPKDWSKK